MNEIKKLNKESLSDRYWIKPIESDLSWESVNFL
jgi:hypothetical protein